MSHSGERMSALKTEMQDERSFVDVDRELCEKVKKWSTEDRKMQKRKCKAEITELTSRNPLSFSTLIFAILGVISPLIVLLLNLSWDIAQSNDVLNGITWFVELFMICAVIAGLYQINQEKKKKRKLYYFSYLLACIEDVEKELGEQ